MGKLYRNGMTSYYFVILLSCPWISSNTLFCLSFCLTLKIVSFVTYWYRLLGLMRRYLLLASLQFMWYGIYRWLPHLEWSRSCGLSHDSGLVCMILPYEWQSSGKNWRMQISCTRINGGRTISQWIKKYNYATISWELCSRQDFNLTKSATYLFIFFWRTPLRM